LESVGARAVDGDQKPRQRASRQIIIETSSDEAEAEDELTKVTRSASSNLAGQLSASCAEVPGGRKQAKLASSPHFLPKATLRSPTLVCQESLPRGAVHLPDAIPVVIRVPAFADIPPEVAGNESDREDRPTPALASRSVGNYGGENSKHAGLSEADVRDGAAADERRRRTESAEDLDELERPLERTDLAKLAGQVRRPLCRKLRKGRGLHADSDTSEASKASGEDAFSEAAAEAAAAAAAAVAAARRAEALAAECMRKRGSGSRAAGPLEGEVQRRKRRRSSQSGFQISAPSSPVASPCTSCGRRPHSARDVFCSACGTRLVSAGLDARQVATSTAVAVM